MVKPRLYSENQEEKQIASYVLNYVFGISMKLLHPFMPFVTTKIYSNLSGHDKKELIVSDWPEIKETFEYDDEEDLVEKVKDIIVQIRNIRSTKNIHPSKKSELIFVTEKYQAQLKELEETLQKLGFGNKVTILSTKGDIPENSINVIKEGIELYIPLEGLIDFEEERNRLNSEKERLEKEVARCEKMLSNPGFVNKAPQTKIDEEKAKLEKYKEMLAKVVESLK